MTEAEIKQAAEEYCNNYHVSERNARYSGYIEGAKANSQKWILCAEGLPATSKKPKNVLCTNNGAIFTAFYTAGYEVEYDGDEDCPDYDEREEKDSCYYLKPGWYEQVESHGTCWDTVFAVREVSAWMYIDALPSPPNTQL